MLMSLDLLKILMQILMEIQYHFSSTEFSKNHGVSSKCQDRKTPPCEERPFSKSS